MFSCFLFHPLNIVKVQISLTGDQRPRQARPLGGSRGSAVPPLGWGMCTPRKKGKVVIRQLLKGKKKSHLRFPQSQKNNMSFFRKDDGWFSDYTTGDYRAHTCLRYQYCCHVVLALECFVLTCIRLWFRMTFHVSFPIFWNGFMVIWFENDFFMLPGTGQRDSRHTWLARKHWGPMEMWWFIMRVGTRIKIYTRRIHGTGIFTYIWVMFMIDVGYIYTIRRSYGIYIYIYAHTYISLIEMLSLSLKPTRETSPNFDFWQHYFFFDRLACGNLDFLIMFYRLTNDQGIVGCTPTNLPLWEIPI